MGYVTYTYYRDTFKGEPVAQTDFPLLLNRASEMVEEKTMYKLSPATFLAMNEAMQGCVKNAVCAQIEFLDANGGSEVDNGVNLQSAGLGKFNYSKASGADGGSCQNVYSPRALRYLAPTGLLYRGGGRY